MDKKMNKDELIRVYHNGWIYDHNLLVEIKNLIDKHFEESIEPDEVEKEK